MLTDLLQKIKAFLKGNQKDLFLAALVFLTSAASFGLGRLSAIWPVKEPIRIEESKLSELSELSKPNPQELNQLNSFNSLNQPSGKFVASQNGSSYHLPSCPGAKQIKAENKIWFKTKTEAQAAGYNPAGNCPGAQ